MSKLYEEYKKISNDTELLKFCINELPVNKISCILGSDIADRYDYYLMKLVNNTGNNIQIKLDILKTYELYQITINKLATIVNKYFLETYLDLPRHDYTFYTAAEISENIDKYNNEINMNDYHRILRAINEAATKLNYHCNISFDHKLTNKLLSKLKEAGYEVLVHPTVNGKHEYRIIFKKKPILSDNDFRSTNPSKGGFWPPNWKELFNQAWKRGDNK